MLKIKGLLPPKLEQLIISQRDISGDIFLVGGAIRNTFFGKEVQDYDFIVTRNPAKTAKRIADSFHGDYYVMDELRGTARALISLNGKKLKVDLAQLMGDSINTDISMRDFTMNAIAIRLPLTDKIVDPLGGELDIINSILRPCSPTSFEDDPVRVIRAIRFIYEFGLSFDPIYINFIRTASKNLGLVSDERKRDEIFNILEKTDVKSALKTLLEFGILEMIFPDVATLEKVELDKPHVHNAWEHTYQVVAYCQQLVDLISNHNEEKEVNPKLKQAFEELKKFQNHISIELSNPINSERSKKTLLLFAGIFHDSGKGIGKSIFRNGRKSFPEHARISAELINNKAKMMGFSKNEIEFLSNIVRFHMKPSRPVFIDRNEMDVQIHRFFKEVGTAGILIGLLHLADVLATYEETISEDRWKRAISSVNNIFEAYFYKFDKIIQPPIIIKGNDLINDFNLSPGKIFKKIITLIVEEQVKGTITSKLEANKFIVELLAEERKQANI